MSSIWGVNGPPVRAASPERILAPVVGTTDIIPDFIYISKNVLKFIRMQITPRRIQITPRNLGCNRLTSIESRGVYTSTTPLAPYDVVFIFVQGKESACIVARDLSKCEPGEDKDRKMFTVKMNLFGLADPRLGEAAVIGQEIEQPAELYPYAFVCALLNADDLNEEKRSKPSSHKESSSRPLNEEAAINFLKQKLENDGFKENIQTAISALQCLYQENIKADEIEVYTVHVDTAHVKDTHKFLSRGEIEMHLAAINLNLGCPGFENAGV